MDMKTGPINLVIMILDGEEMAVIRGHFVIDSVLTH